MFKIVIDNFFLKTLLNIQHKENNDTMTTKIIEKEIKNLINDNKTRKNMLEVLIRRINLFITDNIDDPKSAETLTVFFSPLKTHLETLEKANKLNIVTGAHEPTLFSLTKRYKNVPIEYDQVKDILDTYNINEDESIVVIKKRMTSDQIYELVTNKFPIDNNERNSLKKALKEFKEVSQVVKKISSK